MKADAYRAKRRAALVTALCDCEALLRGVRFQPEYRRAFGVVLRAGAQYDTSRRVDDAPFDDLDFSGAEPDDVLLAVNDALLVAVDALVAAREALKS